MECLVSRNRQLFANEKFVIEVVAKVSLEGHHYWTNKKKLDPDSDVPENTDEQRLSKKL